MCKVGLSEDRKYVTYELELVQEIMRYLSGTGTGKSRQLLSKMIYPCPENSIVSEEELYLRSLTNAERKAVLYGASLQKDSETLKILRTLVPETNSESST